MIKILIELGCLLPEKKEHQKTEEDRLRHMKDPIPPCIIWIRFDVCQDRIAIVGEETITVAIKLGYQDKACHVSQRKCTQSITAKLELDTGGTKNPANKICSIIQMKNVCNPLQPNWN